MHRKHTLLLLLHSPPHSPHSPDPPSLSTFSLYNFSAITWIHKFRLILIVYTCLHDSLTGYNYDTNPVPYRDKYQVLGSIQENEQQGFPCLPGRQARAWHSICGGQARGHLLYQGLGQGQGPPPSGGHCPTCHHQLLLQWFHLIYVNILFTFLSTFRQGPCLHELANCITSYIPLVVFPQKLS